MSWILIKLNGELHAPNGICRPKKASDWEGGEFLALDEPVHAIADFSDHSEVVVGENALIWCHEDWGNGLGLTARGRVSDVQPTEMLRADLNKTVPAIGIRIVDIELQRPPLGLKPLEKPTGVAVLDRIASLRTHRVWRVTDEEYRELFDFAARRSEWIVRQALGEGYELPGTRAGEAVARNKGELRKAIAEAREIALGLRPIRPNQAAFRQRLMEIYQGRCVVSRVSVPVTLEAAHVFPWTGDPVLDEPDNGLILRRDLHALFDAGLWAIEPDASVLYLAPWLRNGPYKKLHCRPIEHHVAPEYILARWTQYQRLCAEHRACDVNLGSGVQ